MHCCYINRKQNEGQNLVKSILIKYTLYAQIRNVQPGVPTVPDWPHTLDGARWPLHSSIQLLVHVEVSHEVLSPPKTKEGATWLNEAGWKARKQVVYLLDNAKRRVNVVPPLP